MSNIGDSARESLTSLYETRFGESPARIVALPGAGSDRRYFRLFPVEEGRGTVIGCYGPDVTENTAFVQLAETFRERGAKVPEIYALSLNRKGYIQEDLGDVSLFSLLAEMSEGEMERYVEMVWRNLVRIQSVPVEEWEDAVMHKSFGSRQAGWDLNYFKYEYLRVSGVIFDEETLEDDFDSMTRALTEIDRRFWGFMYRDCQSRNVMMHTDTPYMIDFQGGRFGPCLYDAVSFLCQARAPFTESFRERMARRYAEIYCETYFGSDKSSGMVEKMLEAWPVLRVFRTLQVLGAYGLRGLVERRAHFVRSIPGALRQLGELVERGYMKQWPELQRVCRLLAADKRFANNSDMQQGAKDFSREATPEKPILTVYVFSFSYMKGYPVDYSGNGGGFMFDCRAMHNPGRYEEYKQLTGRDHPVIEFLEERGEVQEFLKGVWSLVDPAVKRYEQRGFESLQVGFGCTGGQHRSVYCAEHTATHLRECFPGVRVVLQHREQGF